MMTTFGKQRNRVSISEIMASTGVSSSTSSQIIECDCASKPMRSLQASCRTRVVILNLSFTYMINSRKECMFVTRRTFVMVKYCLTASNEMAVEVRRLVFCARKTRESQFLKMFLSLTFSLLSLRRWCVFSKTTNSHHTQ